MEKHHDVKYYVHSLIGVLLMFGVGFLPPIAPLTPMGMQILGVFFGTIYLWSMVDNIWPSVLGLIALGLTDYCTIPEAIAKGMSSPILWQIMLMLIIAGGISETQFTSAVINWLLHKKFVQGRPWVISGIFLFATYFLVVLVNIPAIILMWALLYKMADLVGYKKGDKYMTTMVIGMFVAFIFGNCIFPFTGIRAALCSAYSKLSGAEISYAIYMLVTILVAICSLLLYLAAMKFIFRVDTRKLQGFSVDQLLDEKIELTLREKISIYGFLIGMVFVALIGIVPKSSALGQILNTLSLSGLFALILVVLSAIHIDGKSVINVQQMASKYLQWGVIFIIVAILPIADAISAEETGINAMIHQLLSPVFAGQSPVTFLILVVIISLVLTNIGSNVGMGMLILPIVVQVAPMIGANTTILALLLIYLVNIAFVLPGASPLAALLYGNDWIKPTDIYRYGIFALVITAVVVCVLIYPLLNVLM